MEIFCVLYLSFSFYFSDMVQILLANSADIQLISLENPNRSEIVANKLNQASACDYIYEDKLVFWIDDVCIICFRYTLYNLFQNCRMFHT